MVALLDGHPEINVIPEEFDYFDGIYFLVERFISGSKLSDKEQVDLLFKYMRKSTHIRNLFYGINEDDPRGNFDYRDFDVEAFEKTFKTYLLENGISHKLVFEALARAYASGIKSTTGKKYWLEKTPYHILNVSNRETILNQYFGEYKVIHILRDPRDNYLAYSKKQPSLSIHDICAEWKRVVNVVLNWKSKSKSLLIRYEDLVLNPEATMSKVVEFLSIEENDSLFSPTKKGVPWKGNSMFGQTSTKISKDRVYRYKHMMDEKTKKIIESSCFNEMKALNYEFTAGVKARNSLGSKIARFRLKGKDLYKRNFLKLVTRVKY